jgi:flavin reductase (DIM6/NTAB) family NADH-FMN oxidoreductase RutF
MTVNAFTSVSLQPSLVLICLANDARTTPAVQGRGWFAVNILEASQKELSNRFSLLEDDRFAGIGYSLNEYGLPVLDGCIGHMVCRVFRFDPSGDHFIVLGEVVKAEVREASPLLFFRGSYAAIAAKP